MTFPDTLYRWLSSLPGAAIVLFLLRLSRRMSDQNTGLLSAGIAFYGLLSIFPGLTASVAIAGALSHGQDLVTQSEWITSVLPQAARDIILGQLEQVLRTGASSLSLAAALALAIALYSASRAMGSLIQALNVTFGVTERRSFLWLKLLTVLMTLALIAATLLTLVLIAALPAVAAILGDAPVWTRAALLLRWPALLMLGMTGLALLYRIGPNHCAAPRNTPWRIITPGSLVACGLWLIGSLAFSAYVQSFGTYSQTFGALAGVIVLLTWLWLSGFIVLMGAHIDAELQASRIRPENKA